MGASSPANSEACPPCECPHTTKRLLIDCDGIMRTAFTASRMPRPSLTPTRYGWRPSVPKPSKSDCTTAMPRVLKVPATMFSIGDKFFDGAQLSARPTVPWA